MIKPNDLLETLSVGDLCRTADAYFKSICDPTPQMAKPFSSLMEAPEILQNIGHMLSGLHLGKTMTVLDFAAGTCWFSRFLNQLNCQTISCDASETALDIGKRLFSEFPVIGNLVSEPSFLHFDGHKISLPSESVDRIVCHDGFHHVPNQHEVISELARVLKPGGIVSFSEPGRFHSQSPQSQYEMKNYRVLENDIVLTEIFAIAREHGFTDLKVRVLNDMEVSLDDYECLTSDRRNPSLEESILGNIRQVMVNKTIFFLHKGTLVPDSRSHIGLSCSISTTSHEFSVGAGEDLYIPLKVCNNGRAKWLNKNINQVGIVNIGTHLYDESNNLVKLDFSRHALDSGIEPGQTFEQDIRVQFSDVGKFTISVDLVSEGICWFENVGAKPLHLRVNVHPD
jgi:ubiquinone/menaquinone biosynthesis C-methylase UbiE